VVMMTAAGIAIGVYRWKKRSTTEESQMLVVTQ